MNTMIPMQFENANIRVVTDEAGEPWFVGKDVAEALGYADPTTAIRSHCRGVQKLHPIQDALGRTQEVRVLTEADVLRLIVGSKLPAAERFERWVFEDVLPTIRKTGGYGKPSVDPASLTRADILRLALDSEEKRIAAEAKVTELTPKAIALDRFAEHDGEHNVRNTAKLLGVREKAFIVWMVAHEWLYRDHLGRLCAKAGRIADGCLDTVPVEIRHSDYTETKPQPVVTQKGLAKLAVLLARDGLLPLKEQAA